MGTERKQSAHYTSGKPVLLGDRKMTLYVDKPADARASKRKMTSFVTEMVEYTKPSHLRTHRFEGPELSIFGPYVDECTDQEDLANLDLTRSRNKSMRLTHEFVASQHLKDDGVFRVPESPEECDVVDILRQRLQRIGKRYKTPELTEGLADVLIMYITTRDDNTKLLLRAHSRVLTRHCNAFEELLESAMREITLREYLDRQFMRSRQFDEISSSTSYETEPSLGWCKIQHPIKPVIIPRVVTEAFLALQDARKKALLPPPEPEPPTKEPTDEELTKEMQEKQALDIVKESHKLVAELGALELPDELKEQFEKFAAMVAQCVPLPPIEEPEVEEEEEDVEKEPEPYQRTVRISFSDYAPPEWEKPDDRASILDRRRSTLQKRQSVAQEALAGDTLVRGSLLDGEVMQASEGEGNLVGGKLPGEEPPAEPFDANLVRGSLQKGSLRKGSVVRESLLDGELNGSEVDPPPPEEEADPGPTEEELAHELVEEEHHFFADFLNTLESTPEDSEPEAPPPKPPPVYELFKRWTAAATHAVMEYLYTERCHVACPELPEVFQAANELLLTELTEAITLVPLPAYLRLALLSEANRAALLELCTLTDSVERPDLRTLKKLCESFEYGPDLDRMPYTFTLHTGYLIGRKLEFVEEGFHEFTRVKVNILRVPEPGMRLFKSAAEQARHLIFTKPHPEWVGKLERIDPNAWFPRKVTGEGAPVTKYALRRDIPRPWIIYLFNMFLNRNRDKAWFVTVFGPKIAEECYYFYKHIQDLTHKPMEEESFSLRMVMGFLVCPMMQTSILKAFPKELKVEECRGAGYFIGGEPHGNSMTLTGEPRHLLAAAKALPKNMVGRTSFRVAFPSKTTFIKIFSVAQQFGIDLEMNCIYLLKNLPKIIRALQFFLDLSDAAFVPWDVPREILELVAPCDPF